MKKSEGQAMEDAEQVEREVYLQAVGGRVKQFRRHKQWTQEKLAQEARINDKYIYYIENGKKCMTIWVLAKLANALEVDAETLLGGRCDDSSRLL